MTLALFLKGPASCGSDCQWVWDGLMFPRDERASGHTEEACSPLSLLSSDATKRTWPPCGRVVALGTDTLNILQGTRRSSANRQVRELARGVQCVPEQGVWRKNTKLPGPSLPPAGHMHGSSLWAVTSHSHPEMGTRSLTA